MWTVFRYCVLGIIFAAAYGEESPISREVANSVNDFSLELFKTVAGKKNVVVSPASVSTLLALIQQGAKDLTLNQLTKVLHSNANQSREGYGLLTRNLKSSNNVTLEFANGAFLKDGYEVKDAFKDVLTKDFLSSVELLDFTQAQKAADEINAWVSKHTHDRITHLVSKDMFNYLTRFVLTNAVYFKGKWKIQFEKDLTRDSDFYTTPSSPKQVPKMHTRSHFAIGNLENLNARWLNLKFQGNRFSLLIILPNERDGLESVIQGLTGQELARIIGKAKVSSEEEVILSLPKFKLESTIDLVAPLKQLGLTNIFGGADFSGISKEPVEVSNVIQKAEMEVNEEGATASAATVIGFHATAVGESPLPLVFDVDHPFITMIVDGLNKIPLFTSQVTDPTTS